MSDTGPDNNEVATSAMLNRNFSKRYPHATSAKGIYVTLENGRKVLDGCCGAAVSCLGYGNERVVRTMIEQAQKFAWIHTSFYTHAPQEKLARFLVDNSEGAFSRVVTYSSGSEAVETALKLARQYHLSNDEPDRVLYLSRRDSYHGNTLGALSAGYNQIRREPYNPICSPAFHHVSRCWYSEDAGPGESEQAYLDRLLAEYEEAFQRLGPRRIAAMLVEVVTGATIGTIPPTADYLLRLRKLCDKHGALLIYDEVMCGMGRVGTHHAWQSFGGRACAPDIQAIAKGLAAGYQPLSAVLVNSRVYDRIEGDKGGLAFINGHTYQGHAMACETALTVQNVILDDDLLSNVRRQGERLVNQLQQQLDSSVVRGIRGRGLFQTVEFETTKGAIGARVRDVAFEKGLAVYVCSGTVDAILLAPAFIITDVEIDELVSIFVKAVHQIALD